MMLLQVRCARRAALGTPAGPHGGSASGGASGATHTCKIWNEINQIETVGLKPVGLPGYVCEYAGPASACARASSKPSG